eukprot:Tbor_TRINITY_DN3715_c0_g1::TRINITY_DN3715_c0_g1_i1::g.2506::m.2506
MYESKDISAVTFYPPVTMKLTPFCRALQRALQLEKLESGAVNQISEMGKELLCRRKLPPRSQHNPRETALFSSCSSSSFSISDESNISSHNHLSAPLSTMALSSVLEKGQQCLQFLTSSYEAEDQQEALVCMENRHRGSIYIEEAKGWNLFHEIHKKSVIQSQLITECLLVILEESRYRNSLVQEWTAFNGWAVKSEPEWRGAAQRATAQRLHAEHEQNEARIAAERAAQEKERLRQLALEAIKEEQTNMRHARDAEMQRLIQEEQRMTSQIAERRREQEQRLAALEEKDRQRRLEIQQEEERRNRAKEEEYHFIMAQEKSLEQQLLEKEREQERRAIEEQDYKYAIIMQAEEELAASVAKKEEELKAEIAAKERAKQEIMDEEYARLLEEEYRLSSDIMMRTDARRAEKARVAQEERDRKLRLLEQAKKEEQRLLEAEKERERARQAEIERLMMEEKRLREERLMALLGPPQHQSLHPPQGAQYQPHHQHPYYR